MSTTEERLRDALAATAALVQDDERTVPVAGTRHRRQWYVPLVAAALVLLVVVVSAVVTSGRTHGPENPPAVRPAPTGPPASSPARYFMANVQGGGYVEMSVRDARTGQVTATLKPPANAMWDTVSATGDPHVFYLTANTDQVRLYRLRIDGSGRTRALTEVATLDPGVSDLVFLAASPDGKRVAYPLANPGQPYGPAEIDVLTLATGQRTAFRTTVTGRVSSLSWAHDGRHLAYELDGSANGSDGIWVLDTHGGRDLLTGARHVLPWNTAFVGGHVAPVLSADGRSVYAINTVGAKSRKSTRIVQLDVRTGGLLRVLYEQPYSSKSGNRQWSFTELALDPSGRSLLAAGGGQVHRVTIATGTVTTFPFGRGEPNALAW
jgi:Tol biopolymer transport system component